MAAGLKDRKKEPRHRQGVFGPAGGGCLERRSCGLEEGLKDGGRPPCGLIRWGPFILQMSGRRTDMKKEGANAHRRGLRSRGPAACALTALPEAGAVCPVGWMAAHPRRLPRGRSERGWSGGLVWQLGRHHLLPRSI